MPAACRIRTVPGLTMRPWVRGSLISIRDRRYRAFSASLTESVAEAQLDRAAATASSKHSMKNDTLPRTRRLLPRRRASVLHGPIDRWTSSGRKILLERRVKCDYAERRTGFGGGSSEDRLAVGSRSGPCGATSVTGPTQIE